MKIITLLVWLISTTLFGQTTFQKDFNEFWTIVHDNYAYLDQQEIDWDKVKEIYQPLAANIKSRDEFIVLLEHVINELYNGHSSLNTNLNSSNNIIPSGSDIFIQKKDSTFVISDIRKGYPSELCSLKPGMQVIKFNGKNIEAQLFEFLPKYTKNYNPNMYEYALNMLFAGTHNKERMITVWDNNTEKDFFPDRYKITKQIPNLLEFKILKNNVGYIKINNSLGHNQLINDFDLALNAMQNTNKIIIDLTETPSGGNSAVARAIMSRFIEKEMPYQKHECTETEYKIKRSWIEYVSPRPDSYKNDVIIMVGHWTGSMGEGIAIGFDGLGRAKITGTKMAGLLGAIDGFTLSQTKIGFQIPTERLFHINGTPREDYKPNYLTGNIFSTWEKVNELCNSME